MALIRCPECDREVSDKAVSCPNCGFPILEEQQRKQKEEQDKLKEEQKKTEKEEKEKRKFWCVSCYRQNSIGSDYCEFCGNRLTPYWKSEDYHYLENNEEQSATTETARNENKTTANNQTNVYDYGIENAESVPSFNGIYRVSLLGKRTEVYCPRCRSSNCSWYTQEKVIPGKTKTKYTANLNPLKPFTLVNKKEKVIRKDQVIEQKKIMCNSCGYTFY